VGVFLLKNYIGIFIIKLLMYNQFQILNLISFIICYKCPKKGHFAKMAILTQKMSHFNVHSFALIFFEVCGHIVHGHLPPFVLCLLVTFILTLEKQICVI